MRRHRCLKELMCRLAEKKGVLPEKDARIFLQKIRGKCKKKKRKRA